MSDKSKKKEQLIHELGKLRREISRLKAREKSEQLEATDAEGEFKELVESIPVGVHLYELKSRGTLMLVGANSTADSILGVKNDDYIGKSLDEVFPQFARTDVPEHFRRVASTGAPWETDEMLLEEGPIRGVFEIHAFQTAPGKMAVAFSDVAEKKLTEERLRETEKRFRSIFDNVAVGVAIVDRDGYVMAANGAYCRFLGYVQEEIVGMHFSEFTYLEDFDKDAMLYDGLTKGDISDYVIDKRYVRKDGTLVWGRLGVSQVKDKGGLPQYTVIVCEDITERKRAEEELRESEERYRSLVEASPDAIILTDLNGEILMVNEQAALLYGYRNAAEMRISLQTILDLHLPDNRPRVLEDSRKALETGSISNLEYPMLRKDGTTVPVELNVAVFRDAYGKPKGFIGIGRDVTKRKRTEEELLKSRAKYQNMFNTAPVSLWEADFSEARVTIEKVQETGIGEFRTYLDDHPEFVRELARMTKVLNVNEATLKMYGAKSKVELLGSLDKVFEEETYDIFQELLIAIMEDRKYFEAETTNKTLQRERLNVFLSVKIPPEKSNLLISNIDIGERKKIEEEQIKMDKLESLGTLAGGLAHDFNNLLTAILGNISLAKMYSEPEGSAYERLIESEKASLRARDLTQQLLTFAKGGAPIKRTATLNELIKESTEFALRGSNSRCEFSLPDDLWTVEIDVGQFSQVINNLIMNADQAMPDGGTIEVVCNNVRVGKGETPPLKEGEYVQISIKDHGIGIPADYIEKIFDPYYTTKPKGSGLGLATAYSIVKRHDGFISAESESNVGATIHIYLPVSPTSQQSEERPAGKSEESHAGQGKILVMDDEAFIQDVAREMLRKLGYEVEVAWDGSRALDLYKRAKESGRPFDAVIMDLTIPGGVGGKEAVQKLREIDPAVKAIVSSGYSTDPIMADFSTYGFRGVVMKPYKIQELSNVLYKVLKS